MKLNWDTERNWSETEKYSRNDTNFFSLAHNAFRELEVWNGAVGSGSKLIQGTDYEIEGPYEITNCFGQKAAIYTRAKIINSVLFGTVLNYRAKYVCDFIDGSEENHIIENTSVSNLVYNGNFTLFSNKKDQIATFSDYGVPDGYLFEYDGDALIGIMTDSLSTKLCRIMGGSNSTFVKLTQNIHEYPGLLSYLRGKTITIGAMLGYDYGIVTIDDGVSAVSVESHSTAILTKEISPSATKISVSFELREPTSGLYIQKVVANIGSAPQWDSPPLIHDGAIGQDYSSLAIANFPDNILEYDGSEIPSGFTRLESVLNGKYGRGSNGRSKLPDARGRVMRVWAHGSANDPDRASRTDRGDGVTGDKVGTLQNYADYRLASFDNWVGNVQVRASDACPIGYSVQTSGINNQTVITTQGGNEARMININKLAGMRWC
jgi:hypothetical protein